MTNFMETLEKDMTSAEKYTETENGAIAYASSGSALLDLNFSVSSLRKASEDYIVDQWLKAFRAQPEYAMRWLFFARDVKQGLGERRLFRAVMKYIACAAPTYITPLFEILVDQSNDTLTNIFGFLGRFDDMLIFIDTELNDVAMESIKTILMADVERMESGKPITLLAKWLPSINAGKTSRKLGLKIARYCGMSEKKYKKTLSALRKYLDVVEIKMSGGRWDEINYSHVPSRAHMIYTKAFCRHDGTRYIEYLRSVSRGEVKMNANTIYPYEIVSRIQAAWFSHDMVNVAACENMWINLPDNITDPNSRTLVVADGSYSMTRTICGQTSATALDVCYALAFYFAERLKGEFHNKYITFSRRPQFVDLNWGPVCVHDGDGSLIQLNDSLIKKILIAKQHTEADNTNIEAVFDLLLHTAVTHEMTQDDLPTNILILSDMQFDSCVSVNGSRKAADSGTLKTLFEETAQRWETYGYKLPRLIFWNIAGKTDTIPMQENDLGVCLVSGFSTNVADMVLSGEMDPYKCLVDKIMSKRYDAISVLLGYKDIDQIIDPDEPTFDEVVETMFPNNSEE